MVSLPLIILLLSTCFTQARPTLKELFDYDEDPKFILARSLISETLERRTIMDVFGGRRRTKSRRVHKSRVVGKGFDESPEESNAVRAERSTNISHIVGTSRKIQLIVNKSWYLQIHPDGVVNGTNMAIDSDYTILQRVSVSQLQITITGVASCRFLCMDSCGLLYGSGGMHKLYFAGPLYGASVIQKQYTDECLFNEIMEAHNYNRYSSTKYSNEKRTLYLAFSKRGTTRKVQARAGIPLGKLSSYTNVLTKHVPRPRVEELALRMVKGRYHPLKQIHPMLRHHGHQLCAYSPQDVSDSFNKCHKQKKKKKRKCEDDEDCGLTPAEKKKCEDSEEEEECQRRLHMIRKKRKSRIGDEEEKKKKRLKIDKCKGDDCEKKRGKLREDELGESLLWQDRVDSSEWTTSSAVAI